VNRLAMSEVMSTLVLTSTILLITIVAAFIANSALETQAQKSEFEDAKSAFTLLADIIEDISSNPYASGYVRVNSRSGRLEYKNCAFTITVSVGDTTLLTNTTSSLTFIGGEKIGFIPSEVIYGVSSLAVNNSGTPLTAVFTGYGEGRAFISLNTTRVRIVDRGVTYIKANKAYYHVFDIVFIRLVVKEVQVSGSFTIIVRNVGVWSKTVQPSISASTFQITVSLSYDSVSKEETLNFDLSDESVSGVLFNVITVEVDISII